MQRWHFTEHDKRPPVWWTWRVCSPDGKIEHVSDAFRSYGAAVADAISNGFRPRDDQWVVETSQALVHVGRGEHSVSTRVSRTRRSRFPGAPNPGTQGPLPSYTDTSQALAAGDGSDHSSSD